VWNEIQYHAKSLEALSTLHADINARELNADLVDIHGRISLASTKPGASPATSPKRSSSPFGRGRGSSPFGRKSRNNSSSPDKKSEVVESPRKTSLRASQNLRDLEAAAVKA
jgi:hypothetical protein